MIIRIAMFMLLAMTINAYAILPPVVFNSVSSTNGMPQNTGRAILQDRGGYIWIGTEDGLVRFDGNSMLQFRKDHENDRSLSDNYIGSLAEDSKSRLWVGTMGGGINVIDSERVSVSRISVLATADIRKIVPDERSNQLWLATNEGLYLLDSDYFQDSGSGRHSMSSEKGLQHIPLVLPGGQPFAKTISGIVLDRDDVWFCTMDYGIGRYNIKSQTTTWFRKGYNGLNDDTFNTIERDDSGRIWAGSQNSGLVNVVPSGSQTEFVHYGLNNSGLASDDVMAIEDAGNGMLWVGTWNGGLALFNPDSGKADVYRYQQGNQYSITSDIIMNILRTRNGQIWTGTFDKGVCWFHPESPFQVFRAITSEEEALPSNLIWSFASEGNSALWIGTAEGLARLDLDTYNYTTPDSIQPQTLWEEVRKDDIRAMSLDGDDLWVAGRRKGVFKISLSANSIIPLGKLITDGKELTHPYVRLILKDRQGIIWFGSTKGLNRFDPSSGKIQQYLPESGNSLSLPHQRIRALYEDSKGRIWVGTGLGIMVLDPLGQPIKVLTNSLNEQAKNSQLLAGNGVRGISEDNQHRFWIVTEGGISVYDERDSSVKIFREKNGLPSDATYCAVFASGYMWVTTLHGLVRIHPETFNIETYFSFDGLPDNEFNFNAWHRTADGRIALGTLSGFTIFSPEAVPGPEQTAPPPPLHFQVYIYGQDGSRFPITSGDSKTVVSWDNSKISFEYNALAFVKAESVHYEIMLQGVDDKWIDSNKEKFITYAGLAAGDYNFRFRAVDRHGQWVAESIPFAFSVTAYPWLTPQAYFFYALIFCSLLTLCFIQYNGRLRRRSIYLEDLVKERTGELQLSNQHLQQKHHQLDDLMKSRERLFCAVAHELRTPLTVIMSSLESLQNDTTTNNTTLELPYQQATRIGKLLDTLLDLSEKTPLFSKNGLPVKVASAIDEAITPFRMQVKNEDKVLLEELSVENAWLSMERDTFILILSNLLANAVKYTYHGGTIMLSAYCVEQDNTLIIEVTDDGIGIPVGQEQRIFNWFVRGNEQLPQTGWGVGLAFSKDEVEASGGSLELSHRDGPGAMFTLSLPLSKNIGATLVEEDPLYSQNNPAGKYLTSTVLDVKKSYTLLIVEDDTDLCAHLSTLFPDHWKVLTFSDAETAVETALAEEPDLVITDLMLPGESGFDLTRRLKSNIRTAHIPIIILTALGSEENRLTGLGLSADAFLSKPFKNRELLLRVEGLLSNRNKVFERAKKIVLQNDFTDKTSTENGQVQAEDDFLKKLHEAFDNKEEISSLTLDQAATKMAMSKRSIQREMERLDISWRDYKRLRRVRFAMEILRDSDVLIGDVADQAGYSSAAHFSKIFKEITGHSPSEWRKMNS